MSTGVQVVFDCADPARVAAFWEAALHYISPAPPPPHATWEDWARAEGIPEEHWNDASAVEDPDGVGPRLFFQRVPESKVAKNRMHLDLNVGGGHRWRSRSGAQGWTPRSPGSRRSAPPTSAARSRSRASTGFG